ncbi:hypothetical protein [Sediminibacillus halophilus]|uniref:ABC-2 family transporter protein n=1 Tax=Sediminibacillus halophilus TaxID=482461 RepID=A0A1G9NUM1_9BACI|nr:hypothetical protein [Sediminibacillus halophilus]SDL90286.1 hypothetical protein SAMN05216244_1166 [Sediminibacillus halophilus]
MLEMEWKRVSIRPAFWLAIVAGVVLAVVPAILTWPQHVTEDYYYTYPRSAFISWFYLEGAGLYYIYALLVPLLASIAFADSHAEDANTGFIKNILTKVEKKKYFLVRYVFNFVIGGVVAVFPLILNFLLEMAAYPLIENNYYFGMNLVQDGNLLPGLFYERPFAYVLVVVLLIFLLGGMLASLGLAFSLLVKNRYIVLILPLLVFMALDVLVPFSHSISAVFLYNGSWNFAGTTYLAVGIFGSFIWCIVQGYKHETI